MTEINKKNEGGAPERSNEENAIPLSGRKDVTDAAREEAFGDIDQDPDLSFHHPNDDLDEGETARLGEDRTDLV